MENQKVGEATVSGLYCLCQLQSLYKQYIVSLQELEIKARLLGDDARCVPRHSILALNAAGYPSQVIFLSLLMNFVDLNGDCLGRPHS